MGGRGASSMSGGRAVRPMSIGDAMAVTNPNFSYASYEYSMNCQRCVWAYEMNRRGYECEANPRQRSGDTLPYQGPDGWNSVFEGANLKSVGSPNRNRAVKNVEDEVAGWGEGSRGIVRVKWSRGDSGHVFNVERIGGETVYIDAQCGKRVDLTSYMSRAKPTKTQVMRVDNLKTARYGGDLLEQCVTWKNEATFRRASKAMYKG